MNTSISVILPSKGRLAQCQAVIERFYETAKADGIDLETVVVSEDDDYFLGTVFVAQGGTSVEKWNIGARFATCNWLLLGADDLWPHEHWASKALASGHKGFVGFNDLHKSIATHYMATRDFIKRYMGGCLAIPCYKSWGFDQEVVERAQRVGVYTYVPEAVIEHRHHVWGEAPYDETYRRGSQYHRADMALLDQRRKAGFPNDFEPVLR